MSLTLGEKLRKAREDRGLSISEVAEQTRISPYYLQCIENDDYGPLPGGIFNKGFVRSYAKFVGLNDQEALADYLQAHAPADQDEPNITFRPEVLTDDRASNSSIPSILAAIVILGIMSAGVIWLVNYLRQPVDDSPARSVSNTAPASNTDVGPSSDQQQPSADAVPDMAALRVEFKAVSEPVSLTVNTDGKQSSTLVIPGTAAVFEPKESLKLSYSRSLASNVQLLINGREIALPSQPLQPRRNAIEIEINRDNLARIWASGVITNEVPTASPIVSANTVQSNSASGLATNSAEPSPTVSTSSTPSAPATPRSTPRPTTNVNRDANVMRPTPRPTPDRPAAAPSPAAPRNTAANRPGE